MKKEKTYILGYTAEGKSLGFFLTLSGFKSVYPNDYYYIINKELHSLLSGISEKELTIKVNLESDPDKIYTPEDDIYIYTPQEREIDINKVRKSLCKYIKRLCGNYITSGLEIVLSSGEAKHFSFKVEDQINLSDFVHNKKDGDLIFYHADGEYNTSYTYADICLIYKALYNNKLYNQIYTQILCEWINNNYTVEMYQNKEIVIDYGYTNDDISAEVNIIYEQQKLS